MKKHNKPSYATLANRIIKKYDKRLGDGKYDKLASEAMNRELEQLMEDQENTKAMQTQQQFGTMGEQPMMAHGGYIPQAAYGMNLGDPPNTQPLPFELDALTGKPGVQKRMYRHELPVGEDMLTPSVSVSPDTYWIPDKDPKGFSVSYAGTKDDALKWRSNALKNIDSQYVRAGMIPNVEQLQEGYNWNTNQVTNTIDNINTNLGNNIQKAYGGRLPKMDRGGGTTLGVDTYLPGTHIGNGYNNVVTEHPFYFPATTMNDRYGYGAYKSQGIPQDAIYDFNAVQPNMDQRYGKINRPGIPMEVGNAAYTQQGNAIAQGANNVQPANNTSWWSSIPTESKIGAGIQGATALTQMALALGNKPKTIDYNPTTAPDYVPITNDEQIRQSNLAYMDAERAMRSASPSMYYAGMSKLASDRARSAAGIAEQTANINAQGMNQNAWQKAALNQSNEQMRNRMQMYNNEQGNQYMQNIATGIGNIGNVGAGAMKDLNAYKSEQATLGFMNQPGYGHTYVGSTLVSTVRPAPGFEHYKDPKTNKMVYEHLGKKLKDAKEYNSKLMEWKSKQS